MSENRFYCDSVWSMYRANENIKHLEHLDPNICDGSDRQWLGCSGTRSFGGHYRPKQDMKVTANYLPRYLDHRLLVTRPDCGYETFHPISEPVRLPEGNPKFKRTPTNQLCSGFGFQNFSLFSNSGCFNVPAVHGYPREFKNGAAQQFKEFPSALLLKSPSECVVSKRATMRGQFFSQRYPAKVSTQKGTQDDVFPKGQHRDSLSTLGLGATATQSMPPSP